MFQRIDVALRGGVVFSALLVSLAVSALDRDHDALASPAHESVAPSAPVGVPVASSGPAPALAELPSPDYDLARTGIAWRAGLDAALHRGKPVLLFQLLGDFAKVHC
ncbi:MAG: hypothetical protein IPJ77_08005 [Planctomycetes bacterium]|nr:hypothetical protein [Planctomycetota bacterium]